MAARYKVWWYLFKEWVKDWVPMIGIVSIIVYLYLW